MAKTPEGKVKEAVKKLLSTYSEHGIYWNMPVPTGYGVPMLDFVGCHYGFFFAIETKARGKKPTKRQQYCIETMQAARGAVFVVNDIESLGVLKSWLDTITVMGAELHARSGSFGSLQAQRLGNTE